MVHWITLGKNFKHSSLWTTKKNSASVDCASPSLLLLCSFLTLLSQLLHPFTFAKRSDRTDCKKISTGMPPVIKKTRGRKQIAERKENYQRKKIAGEGNTGTSIPCNRRKGGTHEQNGKVQPTETCTQGPECAFCCCKMKTICRFA